MTTRIASILLAAALLVPAGCGAADKAGGSGDEVTVRVATEDTPDRPGARAIEEFARQAEALSDGSIRVEPVYRAAGEASHDWDQKVARLVTSGEFEAGMIPTRAWDTEGVTTLRPLSAPFLLTTEEAVNRVVSSPVASELLAGLDGAGVVGLALVPEALRHPFGFKEPLVGPEDYRGVGFRTPRSETAYALFRALGARPDDPNDSEVDRQIAAGRLAGAESSYYLSRSLPAAAATGNVTFFPKVNSLVVNEDAWEDLSEEQRSQLREAARRTREWAIENNMTDAEAADLFCKGGGRIVMARDAELEALVAEAQPVFAELERDERTAALIEEIRSLARDVKVTANEVAACDGGAATGGGTGSGETAGGVPDGVYRTQVSVDELVEKGMDPTMAHEYNGVHTLTLREGKLVDVVKSDKPFPPCKGTYESTATTLELRFAPPECSGGLKARWELRDDMLHLSDIRSSTAEETAVTRLLFGAKPFKKID